MQEPVLVTFRQMPPSEKAQTVCLEEASRLERF